MFRAGWAYGFIAAIGWLCIAALIIGIYALAQRLIDVPTPDQRYGCTAKQQAPNGECS